MQRRKRIEKLFQRIHFLTLKDKLYKNWFLKFIADEEKADLSTRGDITSKALIRKDKKQKAIVLTRQRGVVAGLEETVYLYKKNRINVNQLKRDGEKVQKGDILLELEGYQKDLLRIERSALDIMQRMSGIATLVRRVKERIKDKVPIAPTRKTLWKYLDKKAVAIGGALTHRLALWDAVLVKDNHLSALKREGVKDIFKIAIKRAKEVKDAAFIEVETRSKEQVLHVAEILKEEEMDDVVIMLDNMSPKECKRVVKELKKKGLYDHVLLEASGNITPENIKGFLRTGVDVISMGYLTKTSPTLDIKQKIM